MEVEIIHPSNENAIGPMAENQLSPFTVCGVICRTPSAGLPHSSPHTATARRGTSLTTVVKFWNAPPALAERVLTR